MYIQTAVVLYINSASKASCMCVNWKSNEQQTRCIVGINLIGNNNNKSQLHFCEWIKLKTAREDTLIFK